MNHRIANFSSYKSLKKAVKNGMKIRVLPLRENDPVVLSGVIPVEGPKMPYVPAFEAVCRVENGIVAQVSPVGQGA